MCGATLTYWAVGLTFAVGIMGGLALAFAALAAVMLIWWFIHKLMEEEQRCCPCRLDCYVNCCPLDPSLFD